MPANQIGEAPQYSSTFAKYDNGNFVFPLFYADFISSTGWTNFGSGGGSATFGTVNGLALGSSTSWYGYRIQFRIVKCN